MSRLILIRGIPGSGKSTLAQSFLHDDLVDVHLEADMYHIVDGIYQWKPENVHGAHLWCQDQTEMALHRGKRVVVSNTFIHVWELKPYFQIARKYDIIPSIFKCNGGYQNIHNVPEETVLKMKNRFQEDISILYKEVQ